MAGQKAHWMAAAARGMAKPQSKPAAEALGGGSSDRLASASSGTCCRVNHSMTAVTRMKKRPLRVEKCVIDVTSLKVASTRSDRNIHNAANTA